MCHDNLEEPSIKLRTCTKEVCEYIFDETFQGGLLSELKYFSHEAHFDLSIASKAICSSRVTQIFEPFPTFFLKEFELRTKRGNLDAIKKAQQTGKDVNNAAKTKEGNKDAAKMVDIICELPSIDALMANTENEKVLR